MVEVENFTERIGKRQHIRADEEQTFTLYSRVYIVLYPSLCGLAVYFSFLKRKTKSSI